MESEAKHWRPRTYADAFDSAIENHTKFRLTDDRGKALKAMEDYLFALRGNPEHPQIIMGLGDLYSDLGEWGLGIAMMNYAYLLNPNDSGAINNLAVAYNRAGYVAKARAMYERALRLHEEEGDVEFIPAICNNIATTWIYNDTPEKAVEWTDRGLAIDPNRADCLWTKAQALLEAGRYDEALPLYHRHQRVKKQRLYLSEDKPIPVWDGSPGKAVLLVGEQGVGDEVMFMQALPDLIRDSKHVVIDCTKKLVNIVRASFPQCSVFTSDIRTEAVPYGGKIDAMLYMADLFYHYRREGWPKTTPYLTTTRPEMPEGINIGLSWIGGTPLTRMHMRSMPLSSWAPILGVPGVNFHSIQYTHDAGKEVAAVSEALGVKISHDQDMIDDLDKQAAFVGALDLMVTVPTAAMHLAAAQDVHCLVLAPRRSGWTFGKNAFHWYPSVTRLGQGEDEAWEPVIEEAARRVRAVAGIG